MATLRVSFEYTTNKRTIEKMGMCRCKAPAHTHFFEITLPSRIQDRETSRSIPEDEEARGWVWSKHGKSVEEIQSGDEWAELL
jgi:hypothetical protein